MHARHLRHVLVELLNMFAERGPHLRQAAAAMVQEIMDDASIVVVPQTRHLFLNAVRLYRERIDQDWSVTDCASFLIMEQRGISSALTHDRHFEQRGYRALLRD